MTRAEVLPRQQGQLLVVRKLEVSLAFIAGLVRSISVICHGLFSVGLIGGVLLLLGVHAWHRDRVEELSTHVKFWGSDRLLLLGGFRLLLLLGLTAALKLELGLSRLFLDLLLDQFLLGVVLGDGMLAFQLRFLLGRVLGSLGITSFLILVEFCLNRSRNPISLIQ